MTTEQRMKQLERKNKLLLGWCLLLTLIVARSSMPSAKTIEAAPFNAQARGARDAEFNDITVGRIKARQIEITSDAKRSMKWLMYASEEGAHLSLAEPSLGRREATHRFFVNAEQDNGSVVVGLRPRTQPNAESRRYPGITLFVSDEMSQVNLLDSAAEPRINLLTLELGKHRGKSHIQLMDQSGVARHGWQTD